MPSPFNRRCALAFAIVYPTLLTWIYFVYLAKAPSTSQQAAYGIGKAIQFIFPVAWAWLFSRRSIGLPKATTKGLAAGVLFGLAVGGGIIAAYHLWLTSASFFTVAVQPMVAKLEGLGLRSPSAFILLGVFYAIVHSALEEYYWRWFVFGQLRQVCSFARGDRRFQPRLRRAPRAHHRLVLWMGVARDLVVLRGGRRRRRILGLALSSNRVAPRPLAEPSVDRRRDLRDRLPACVLKRSHSAAKKSPRQLAAGSCTSNRLNDG